MDFTNKIFYKFSYVLIFSIFLGQFLIVPFFGDINLVAKSTLVSAVVIIISFIYVGSVKLLKFHTIYYFYIGIFIFSFFSSLLSVEPQRSLYHLGFLVVLFFLSFLVSSFSTHDTRYFLKFNAGLLFIGVVASCLGLYEYVHTCLLGPTDISLIPSLLPPDRSLRVGGMFGQSNLFALFLNTVIFSFYYRFLVVDDCDGNSKIKLLQYLPAVLVVAVFFLTASRAGFLAFFVTSFLCVSFFSKNGYLAKGNVFRARFVALCYATICGFLIGLIIEIIMSYFVNHDLMAARLLNISGVGYYLRLFFGAIAIAIFKDHFLWGVGLGNFELYSAPYRHSGADLLGFSDYELFTYTKWAHNDLLQLLSEVGLVVFCLILFLLVFYLYNIVKYSFYYRDKVKIHSFFVHVFLMPFIVQSNFEYPFYHPSTLFLFFTFLGFCIADKRSRTISVPSYIRTVVSFFLVFLLIFNVNLIIKEVKLGSFYSKYCTGRVTSKSLDALSRMGSDSFIELSLLQRVIPYYTRLAMKSNSFDFARSLLPYAKRLVCLQDLEAHWFNLAVLYYKLNIYSEAKSAAEKAVYLSPNHTLALELIHILNMKQASLDTGMPIENFYPNSLSGKYQMSEIFRVNNKY